MALSRAPELEPHERAARLAAERRADVRRQRRRWAFRIGGCLGSLVGGMALVGAGLHTTDPTWGGIALWAGLLVGYGGTLLTLVVDLVRDDGEG